MQASVCIFKTSIKHHGLMDLFSFLGVQLDDDMVDLPPLLDSDDIAYFFENDDINSLHWALKTVFDRGQRNPEATRAAIPLPEQLITWGGRSTYMTAYKLQHRFRTDNVSSN